MMNDEILQKRREFFEHTKKHMKLLRKAFNMYGKILCDKLDVDHMELYELICKHDASKLTSKEEFEAFRKKSHPANGESISKEEFDKVWAKHVDGNPHHEEHWHRKHIEMPKLYIAEMLLDWVVEQQFEGRSIVKYYNENKDKKGFTQRERKIIESVIMCLEKHDCVKNKCHDNKITEEHVHDIIRRSKIHVQTLFDKTTVVSCKLPNGFVIVESSGAVCKENYSKETGYKTCMKKIVDKVWMLEGYALACKLHGDCED